MHRVNNRARASLPSLFNPRAEVRLRRAAADILGTARCPLCRHPLVARMQGGKPSFCCGCARARQPGDEPRQAA
jgi:hypothetical protein